MLNINKKEDFIKEFNENGFVIRDSGFSKDFIDRAGRALLESIEIEAKSRGTKNYREYGLLLCSAYFGDKYPVFLEFFENNYFFEPFDWILDKWNITFLYSCACIPPKSKISTSNIHIDLPRFIPDYNCGVGAIFCIDDYTEENGATWILPKSHLSAVKPDEEYFYNNAIRFTAKAGTVCYFHQSLWHAAGQNNSDKWRRSLNIGMIRPWMKQRIDIPEFLKHLDTSNIPHNTLQKLGFHSIPPKGYDDYFAEINKRSFSQPYV